MSEIVVKGSWFEERQIANSGYSPCRARFHGEQQSKNDPHNARNERSRLNQ